jgi:hypothetical protein
MDTGGRLLFPACSTSLLSPILKKVVTTRPKEG